MGGMHLFNKFAQIFFVPWMKRNEIRDEIPLNHYYDIKTQKEMAVWWQRMHSGPENLKKSKPKNSSNHSALLSL